MSSSSNRFWQVESWPVPLLVCLYFGQQILGSNHKLLKILNNSSWHGRCLINPAEIKIMDCLGLELIPTGKGNFEQP
jgi:hypothetical protein